MGHYQSCIITEPSIEALINGGCDVAIPDYQSLMLPVLKLASDGEEHRMSDVVDSLARPN
jgi:hypothetical protein